jgi:hypothetical protein
LLLLLLVVVVHPLIVHMRIPLVQWLTKHHRLALCPCCWSYPDPDRAIASIRLIGAVVEFVIVPSVLGGVLLLGGVALLEVVRICVACIAAPQADHASDHASSLPLRIAHLVIDLVLV